MPRQITPTSYRRRSVRFVDSSLYKCRPLFTLNVCCAHIRGFRLAVALNRSPNDNPLCRTLRDLSVNALRNVGEWDIIQQLDPAWIKLVRRQGLHLKLNNVGQAPHESQCTVNGLTP